MDAIPTIKTEPVPTVATGPPTSPALSGGSARSKGRPVGLVTLVPDDAADLPTVYAIPPQSQGNQGGLQMVVRGRELHDVHMFNFSRTDTIEHAIQTLQREGLVPTDRPIFSAAPEEQRPAGRAPGWSIADQVDNQRLSDDFTMGFGGGAASSTQQGSQQPAKDIAADPMLGRLSEEFMDLSGLDGLDVSLRPSGAQRNSEIDQQALAALNGHSNRIRRTSSEAVMAMLAGDGSSGTMQTEGQSAGTGAMNLERSSSEALMSFLVDT